MVLPVSHPLLSQSPRARPGRRRAGGRHLIFGWTRQGIEYMILIHAWEPLERAVATLHAVVLSAAP